MDRVPVVDDREAVSELSGNPGFWTGMVACEGLEHGGDAFSVKVAGLDDEAVIADEDRMGRIDPDPCHGWTHLFCEVGPFCVGVGHERPAES